MPATSPSTPGASVGPEAAPAGPAPPDPAPAGPAPVAPAPTAGVTAPDLPPPVRPPDPDALRRRDPELAGILAAEVRRQSRDLQLIAAENFTSEAVLAALGSPLGDKYAEGYPGARHHGGCEIVDVVERLAVDRATSLFGGGHANVQPHSGSSAVLAAYAALLRPGDTVLAMALTQGGHLTHGSPANFSGRWFDFVGYGVDRETGLLDYDEIERLARAHRPKAMVCGSISYPRHPDYAALREIADDVGAHLVVDAAHPIGLVAGGAAPSPVPYADVVCATTHKVLRGPRGGMVLCREEAATRIDRAVFPFVQGGAQMNAVAAKAVAFAEATTPEFAAYARRVVANARALAAGLAAEGLTITTGGTDTHMITADVAGLGLDGRAARARCAAAGIVLDTCALPHRSEPPARTTGIRLGTAAVTTQGMGKPEMARIAALLGAVLRGEPGTDGAAADLTAAFPPRTG